MYSITVGSGASSIAYQLGQNNKNLQKSLQRLSTMKRVNSGADDPGGLAVSMKLGISIRRTEAALSQVTSTSSFLETQDGVLNTANSILLRMAELAQYSGGTTDTTSQALYQIEFSNLQQQVDNIMSETFNGISLFRNAGTTNVNTATTLAATISLAGQTMGVSQSDLGSVTRIIGTSGGYSVDSQSNALLAGSALSLAQQNLAQLRAINGSELNRINFASDLLTVNKENLEAANSRIVDLDYASEMVNYTRYGFIQDTNLALLSQANTRWEKILKLLE